MTKLQRYCISSAAIQVVAMQFLLSGQVALSGLCVVAYGALMVSVYMSED